MAAIANDGNNREEEEQLDDTAVDEIVWDAVKVVAFHYYDSDEFADGEIKPEGPFSIPDDFPWEEVRRVSGLTLDKDAIERRWFDELVPGLLVFADFTDEEDELIVEQLRLGHREEGIAKLMPKRSHGQVAERLLELAVKRKDVQNILCAPRPVVDVPKRPSKWVWKVPTPSPPAVLPGRRHALAHEQQFEDDDSSSDDEEAQRPADFGV